MKISRITLLSFLILVLNGGFSQTNTIDSLKMLLVNAVGENKAQIQNDLATEYTNIDYQKALSLCDEAQKNAIRAVSPFQEARSYFIKGNVYAAKQNFDNALENFSLAHNKFKSINNDEYIQVLQMSLFQLDLLLLCQIVVSPFVY